MNTKYSWSYFKNKDRFNHYWIKIINALTWIVLLAIAGVAFGQFFTTGLE